MLPPMCVLLLSIRLFHFFIKSLSQSKNNTEVNFIYTAHLSQCHKCKIHNIKFNFTGLVITTIKCFCCFVVPDVVFNRD